jgi:hypothetical protein
MADEEEVIPARFQRRLNRQEAVRSMAKQRIRVVPSSDEIRRVMRHPAAGGFRSEGSVEWPLDQFTKRRLSEGSVLREASSLPEQETVVSPEQETVSPQVEKTEQEKRVTPRRPATST